MAQPRSPIHLIPSVQPRSTIQEERPGNSRMGQRGGLANNGQRGGLTNNGQRPGNSNWRADENRSPGYDRRGYQQQQNHNQRGMSNYGRGNNRNQGYHAQRNNNYSPYQPQSGYNSETGYRSDNRHQGGYQSDNRHQTRYNQQQNQGGYRSDNRHQSGYRSNNRNQTNYNRPINRDYPSGSIHSGRQSRNWQRDDDDYLNDVEVTETLRQQQLSDLKEDERSEEDYDSDDGLHADKPLFLRDLFESDSSYSEKMAYVAEKLLALTMDAVSNCGYNDFELLANDFYDHYRFDPNILVDSLGYIDFKSMCLNAPEIVCVHTWDMNKALNGEYVVANYRPRYVDKKAEKLIEEKRMGEQHQILRRDEIEKDVARVMEKPVLPTIKELDFKYQLCQVLDNLNGLQRYVSMDQFKVAYERTYNELLNAELYREKFDLKTNYKLVPVQKERLFFEMNIVTNKSNNGLIYKLRKPLSVIKQYHDRLKEEIAKRRQEEEALTERVRLKNMAVPEFVKTTPRGRKTPPPVKYKVNDFELLDEDDTPFEDIFTFG